MHDQFVADVGDFCKYIMLNKLSEIVNGRYKIGINWYYNRKPTNTLTYLHDPDYERINPVLFNQLKTIITDSNRNLSRIWRDAVLPVSHFIHFHDEIPYQDTSAQRGVYRTHWFDRSTEKLKDADIVFLDPDNGIPYPDLKYLDIKIPSIKPTHPDAIKYTYVDEIEKYYSKGKSVIVYQNIDRKGEMDRLHKLQLVKDAVRPGDFLIIRFKKVQVRFYVFILQAGHVDEFRKLIAILTSAPFDFLFDEVNPSS